MFTGILLLESPVMRTHVLLLMTAGILSIGCRSGDRDYYQGKVAFVIYETEPGVTFSIRAEPKPADRRDPADRGLERWNADPYVELGADYARITYKKEDGTRITHIVPREKLNLLRP